MKKIILLRHAESAGNIDRTQYEKFPDYAIRLSQRGSEQAKSVGLKLKEINGDFRVMTSSYFRARQTLDFLAETLGENRILSSIQNCCLREQEWASNPKPYDHIGDEWRNKMGSFYYRFDNAESGADCYNRTLLFHELMVMPLLRNKQDSAENLLIVTHGYLIRIYLKILLGWTVEEMELCRNPKNCEIIQLSIEEDGSFKLESQLNIRPARVAKFHYDKNDLYVPENKA